MKAHELFTILKDQYGYDNFEIRRLFNNLFNFTYDINTEKELDTKITNKILTTLQNNKNYPLEYLCGEVVFYNRNFKVTPDVLIPRNETEGLCELIIKNHKDNKFKNILDIGTGSGVLGITLSLEFNLPATLLDISPAALKIARYNVKTLDANIELLQSDFLSTIEKSGKKYDLIVSNPPYIGIEDEIGDEIKYEPSLALYCPNEGLESYFRIIKDLDKVLTEDGIAYFETSSLHHDKYVDLKNIFPQFEFTFMKDSYDRWRYMVLKRK